MSIDTNDRVCLSARPTVEGTVNKTEQNRVNVTWDQNQPAPPLNGWIAKHLVFRIDAGPTAHGAPLAEEAGALDGGQTVPPVPEPSAELTSELVGGDRAVVDAALAVAESVGGGRPRSGNATIEGAVYCFWHGTIHPEDVDRCKSYHRKLVARAKTGDPEGSWKVDR